MAIWRTFWKHVDHLCDPVTGAACLLAVMLFVNWAHNPQDGAKLYTVTAPAQKGWTQMSVHAPNLCPLHLLQYLRLEHLRLEHIHLGR